MLLNLSDLSNEPLYSQVLRQIRAQILTGHVSTGDPIPSIRDLARTYKISVMTVQRAYDELIREGLVVARRGKGYYVADLLQSDRDHVSMSHCKDALKLPIALALGEGVPAEIIHKLVDELIQEMTKTKGGEE
ncbi:MAG TPA: GntR family transcriptional regulator [Oligoflexus sp.]|uniref:GntR family transcriptional regulator n=1 Tax=Oligoflexus sp. TaxID=1971216 RepID=UPI002D48705C|nr:GntR family transcriptional regulator [Oligoflexus sp.]HYX32535.1 GntR family transcriptional regulator [Oligoflexus sp.]